MTDTITRLQELIEELSAMPEMKQLATPPAIQMTQNHYGHYMSVLAQLHERMPVGDREQSYSFHAAVLIRAGANEQGIRDALQVSF